jgi:hypothetical protein
MHIQVCLSLAIFPFFAIPICEKLCAAVYMFQTDHSPLKITFEGYGNL